MRQDPERLGFETRLARHGMALAPLPERRSRYNLRRGAHALDERPIVEGMSAAPWEISSSSRG
jgi:hypothetical protein